MGSFGTFYCNFSIICNYNAFRVGELVNRTIIFISLHDTTFSCTYKLIVIMCYLNFFVEWPQFKNPVPLTLRRHIFICTPDSILYGVPFNRFIWIRRSVYRFSYTTINKNFVKSENKFFETAGLTSCFSLTISRPIE